MVQISGVTSGVIVLLDLLVGTVDITQISFVNGIQLLFYKSSGVM